MRKLQVEVGRRCGSLQHSAGSYITIDDLVTVTQNHTYLMDYICKIIMWVCFHLNYQRMAKMIVFVILSFFKINFASQDMMSCLY